MSAAGYSPSAGRILIASASVGAGHNQAARAIADALRAAVPAWEVTVTDVLTHAPWPFRLTYAGGYSLLVSHLPWLYGLGFWLNDRPQTPRRGWMERGRLWTERLNLRRLGRFLAESRPDLIINTHFLAAPFVGRLIRRGRLPCRQMVVVTDIRVHRWWYAEQVEHWFVPAEPTAERLRRWGIDRRRITVSGMPIHPKWSAELDRARIFADWRLPSDRPIVLVSGGTDFVCGPVVRIVQDLAAACPRAFIAVLAGRNKDLLAALSRLSGAGEGFVGLGFTDRIHELVEVCSLMVTKAGGLTTAECLAKGTPMVLLRPVPGQESGNAAHFVAEGAAVPARDPDGVVAHVRRLLEEPGELARMACSARRLYRPGTQTIVQAVCRALGQDRGPQTRPIAFWGPPPAAGSSQ